MRTRLIVIALLCASLPFSTRAFAAAPPTPAFQAADIVRGELVVILKTGYAMSALQLPDQARAAPQKEAGQANFNGSVLVQVPPGQEGAYIAKFKQQAEVLIAEPNYIVRADVIPNDTSYPLQYAPALIQAEDAWDVTTGSNSVIIAIIDSGLDATHPEFAGRTAAGYDFIQGDSAPQDEFGHGTHVAGIAAATGNNGQGMAGLAWGVKIMPLRVLNASGIGTSFGVSEAIKWAANHGAKIINLSLGLTSPSEAMEDAVSYAYNRGAAIFAASGNGGTSSVYYPAAYPQVMAVGSVDSAMTRASSSSYGAELDLMAPGVNIYSTLPMNSGFYYNMLGKSTKYDYLSGTSMASPHAAGAAALLASLPCFDTPDKIYQALMDSARDLGGGGWDQYYGYGLIQIADAIALCDPPTFAVEYDIASTDNCDALVQYNWVDASAIPDTSYLLGNEYYRSVSLPFNFTFGETDYTAVTIHDNGFISLGGNKNTTPASSTAGNYRFNDRLPTSAKPDNFIAPFWDDLANPSGSARVFVKTIGSAPARQFVIEYYGAQRAGVFRDLTFEVILFESSNEIKMQYRALSGSGSDGSSATVGLEYGNAFSGLAAYEYSYNQPAALHDELALLFIPYTSGTPSLPTDSVCPQMKAITLEAGAANLCSTTPNTFDVEITTGELLQRSVLKVQQVNVVPVMPTSFLDLQHYADIHLNYSPPLPSPSPLPEVDVCYEYSAEDLLTAGGHPENLFIAAHNQMTNQWQRLPTTLDEPNSQLKARAPHFSYYGVATLNPAKASASKELGLPVTGSPLSREFLIVFAAAVAVFISSGIWLRRKHR